MLLGDRKPAPPDLEKRHQEFSRKGSGFTFVEDSPLLEEPHRRLAGCRTLYELVAQQDVTEFLSEDPSSFLFRGEPMVAVEDDRALTGNVTDGPSDPIEEDPLNNGHTSKVDDRLHIYGWFLAGERQQPPRSTASELVAYFSTFW